MDVRVSVHLCANDSVPHERPARQQTARFDGVVGYHVGLIYLECAWRMQSRGREFDPLSEQLFLVHSMSMHPFFIARILGVRTSVFPPQRLSFRVSWVPLPSTMAIVDKNQHHTWHTAHSTTAGSTQPQRDQPVLIGSRTALLSLLLRYRDNSLP